LSPANKISCAALDGDQWGTNYEGFDFDLPNTMEINEIPPPGVSISLSADGRAVSRGGKRPGTSSGVKSLEKTADRAKSPDRPIFACRAFNTQACMANTIPNKQEIDHQDNDPDAVAPLSPSPFLQSKFVSGVFLVANREGQKMIVRGPPIVSPIWYVYHTAY
jgi:hypothetical protein